MLTVGPYGGRVMTYLDYTASGRNLSIIEDYIRDNVMPLYANTHTTSSATGLQTSLYRTEARSIIKNSLHGNDDDVVFFTGTGSTGAITLLIKLLGLQKEGHARNADKGTLLICDFPGCGRYFQNTPALKLHQRTHSDGHYLSMKTKINDDSFNYFSSISEVDMEDAVVVFVGPYEHHSNLLQWRESIAHIVVEIKEAVNGGVDMEDLKLKLTMYARAKTKIGSFSAASNLTGQMVDVDRVTQMLHEHGALSFWDYATAASHVKIDMNPPNSSFSKDAVFISPHKLIGGPGTPGLLIMKKQLICNPVPTAPGGGTVFFVTSTGHTYLENIEEREEVR
jgi:selenocysteine lyase/cysteine desulfurase